MIEVHCLGKLKDKNNIIYGYKLQNKATGQIMDVDPLQLKNAMALQQCVCDNLTLTSDWRLVSKNEKIEINW